MPALYGFPVLTFFFGLPPSLPLAFDAITFAGDEMLPSITAGLISFPQCGQFIGTPIAKPLLSQFQAVSGCAPSSDQAPGLRDELRTIACAQGFL